MADTAVFRRHALLPKPQPPEPPWHKPLSESDLLHAIADRADRIGAGRGVTYLLVALPDPLLEQLELAGAETIDDEDTNDAEPEQDSEPDDWDFEDSDDDRRDHPMTEADAGIRFMLRARLDKP